MSYVYCIMKTIHTAQNRPVSWHEWGAPHGRTVIICPGAGMAGALPFGEDRARQSDLRMISVDRAGLGNSAPDTTKSFTSWCDDIRTILAHIGTETADIIGFSQGAPFALALGAANIARTVSIVSGQDELSHPDIFSFLPEPVAAMVLQARSDAEKLEAEMTAFATADWLWHMIETMSGEQDRLIYASEDFAPAYRAALNAGFQQGAAGYARDTVLAMAPWPFKLEDITCPVHLWYGLKDTSPVHSPDFGASLSKRIKNVQLHHFEEDGSAILWTKADKILSKIA